MSISAAEALTSGIAPLPRTPEIGGTGQAGQAGPSGPSGPSSEFAAMLTNGIDSLEGFTDKAANLSVQAATGDLNAIHDYTIAATEAQLATQLTVAVRDKAVSAFQQIMQMQV